MQKTITVCDKCHKEITGEIAIAFGYDFCELCAKEAQRMLLGWIEGKAPEKVPDWGAAQSLRNAGWPAIKIAKELGVSQSAVYDHTHAPAKKKKYPLESDPNEPGICRSPELI